MALRFLFPWQHETVQASGVLASILRRVTYRVRVTSGLLLQPHDTLPTFPTDVRNIAV